MAQDPGQLRHCVVSPPSVSDSGTLAGPETQPRTYEDQRVNRCSLWGLMAELER